MHSIAGLTTVFAAVFTGAFVAIFLAIFSLGDRGKAAHERAHARRIAEARMNARLLRLNL